jgi:hypothetical protein
MRKAMIIGTGVVVGLLGVGGAAAAAGSRPPAVTRHAAPVAGATAPGSDDRAPDTVIPDDDPSVGVAVDEAGRA